MMTLTPEELYDYVSGAMADGRSATITPAGTSMLPFLRPGDSVRIERADAYRRGDIVLARCPGGRHSVVLHCVLGVDPDGTYTLMGTANLRMTETCSAANVCGKVADITRKGRHISTASAAHRACVAIWLALRPARRPLLYIYRKIHRP